MRLFHCHRSLQAFRQFVGTRRLHRLLISGLFSLLLISVPFAGHAQFQPSYWTGDDGIRLVRQEVNPHGGNTCLSVVVESADEASCDLVNSLLEVNAGDTYTLSFYYNTSAHVRIQPVFEWAGAAATFGSSYAGDGVDDADWMLFTLSGTVPAGATGVKLGLRFGDQSGFEPGERQFLDDVVFESPTATVLDGWNGNFEQWQTRNWMEVLETGGSPDNTDNSFGYSVAVSGDYAIVGAPYEYCDAAGGNCLMDAGAAFILYRHQGGTDQWGQVKKIVPSLRQESDLFGVSVDIDGDYAVVGTAFINGLTAGVWVFYRNEGTANSWGEVAKLEPENSAVSDQFGYSLAISEGRVVIGAPYESYNAAGADSIEHAGAVYLFEKDYPSPDSWGLREKVLAPDRVAGAGFGISVDLAGDYLAVGAIGVATDAGGGNPVAGAGAAYVFYRNQGSTDSWDIQNKVVADERLESDFFGLSVTISGDALVVGAPYQDYDSAGLNYLENAGAAFAFARNEGGDGNWGQTAKIVASDRTAGEYFGESLAMGGASLIAGVPRNDTDENGLNPESGAGAVYVYSRDHEGEGQWGELRKMTSPNREESDYFGRSVDVSGELMITGAEGDWQYSPGGDGEVHFFKPFLQAGSIQFSGVGTDRFTVDWSPGDGEKSALFLREGIGDVILPEDSMTYTGGSVFKAGTQIGASGWYCVYNGTGTNVEVTGLNNNATYRAMVYSYSGVGGAEVYVPFMDDENPAYQKMGSVLAGVGIHVGNELITSTTTDMEYSLNSTDGTDGDWSDCTEGNTSVVFSPGEVWLRQKSLTDNFRLLADIPPAPEQPAFSISYVAETTAEVVPTTVEYNTDNDFSTTNTNGEGSAIDLVPGTDLYFRVKATETTLASEVQTLVVPARPVAPVYTINFDAETTIEAVPDTVEYALFADMTGAVSGTGIVVALAPGSDLYFRVMATEQGFRSAVVKLDVPDRPGISTAYTIDYPAEQTAENVNVTDEYDDDAAFGDAVAGTGEPAALVPGTDMYFRKKATLTEFASAIQHMVVAERPAKTTYTIDFENEATDQNIELEHEYGFDPALADAVAGQGVILDLEPGVTIYFRVRSTASSFSGVIQTMIVPDRPAAPVVSLSDKNAAFAVFKKSTDGTGETVQLSDKMEYTLDAGINWVPITNYTTVDATGSNTILVREMATTFLFASASTGNLDYEQPVVSVVVDTACTGAADHVVLQSSVDNGYVYIVEAALTPVDAAALESALATGQAARAGISASGTDADVATGTLSPGSYRAYAVDDSDSLSAPAAGLIVLHPLPVVDLGTDLRACSGDELTLDGGTGYASYLWSPGNETTPQKVVTESGDYVLAVTDANACLNTDTVNVDFALPYDGAELCMVTIDELTGRNLLVWEKTPDAGILSYRLYRQTSQAGQYEPILTQPYETLSLYTDMAVDPEVQQWVYKLTAIDTCGNESDIQVSPYHKPLFLQFVSTDDGVNLEWEPYEVEGAPLDFVTYKIYRGSDSLSLAYLDEVSGDLRVYKDKDPQALKQRYWYRVAGVKAQPCLPSEGKKAASEPYYQSLSNLDDNRWVGTGFSSGDASACGLEIWPNPVDDHASIRFDNPEGTAYTLRVMDLDGRVLMIREDIHAAEIDFDPRALAPGIYTLSLSGKKQFRGKMVVR